jgi:DNA-binding transcriptional ArsR family regulator
LVQDDIVIEAELKGKTMIVYMHLVRLNQASVGVREVQRALGFSSPSVAAYHLNKLRELGLVKSERGDYSLVREVKIGVLRQFVTLGGFMLPRLLFYAVLVTTMLATYVLQFQMNLTKQNITTLLMGVVPTIILWYETLKIWRGRPK